MKNLNNTDKTSENVEKELRISDIIKRIRYTFSEISKPGSLGREKPITTYANNIKEADTWFRNNYKGWIYQILEWEVEYI